ncbi:unnamed protein product [Protopolystoma xenopodis]|uniref:RabBD domain-containing protein n=1 Tax=Protopolystoma xenopodis TaxID=117903 RepID=A0A3S5FE17_9PLAT|nr:unnamed protein product [Protopolystoma xenopodis]
MGTGWSSRAQLGQWRAEQRLTPEEQDQILGVLHRNEAVSEREKLRVS